jgi:hypothetical protein
MFSRRMVKDSARDCSKLVRVQSKKDFGCTEGKMWLNTIIIKKYVEYL